MLSKILRKPLACSTTTTTKVGFSSLKKATANLFNPAPLSNPHAKIATFNPLEPVINPDAEVKRNGEAKHQISKLENGVTVLTETGLYPNVIDFGILFNLGSRDENLRTSGSLATLKNNYHETLLTIQNNNYDLVQNSGGEIDMEYDQENTYFKANCLAHHVDDLFSTMVETALKPLPIDLAKVSLHKIQEEVQGYLQMGGSDDLNDSIMQTAYGLTGLGMPLGGIKQNILRLTPEGIRKFQLETIQPENIYVCAAGVENHSEFVKFVESKLSFLPKSGRTLQRAPAEYKGGELIKDNGGEEATVALAFKSVSWKEKDVYTFQVLNTLLGSSASFSTGGPGKGMHSRATKNLLNRLSFVDSANALCTSFTDSGLFGLILSGPSGDANELLKAIINEMKGLARPIPPIELERAKNITKSNILMALERQKDRLEESVKNIKTFGRLQFHEYAESIDQVTSEQINLAVAKMLLIPPTYVVEGGGLSKLYGYDTLQNMLRL